MAEKTSISWTDHTFNPWWGCTKVSPGCANCYAERDAKRYGHDVWGPGKPRRVFGTKHWGEPFRWNRVAERDGVRKRVFCASMADVFEDEALVGERNLLFDTIDATPHLDWQLLTKRPENFASALPAAWLKNPRENVWLGVSVEDRKRIARIGILRGTPATVRFLSIEPQIEDLGVLDLSGISWVIVGGESGPGARPFDVAWARSAVAQCKAAGVSVFVKQLGARPIDRTNTGGLAPGVASSTYNVRWQLNEDLRVQEFPACVVYGTKPWVTAS